MFAFGVLGPLTVTRDGTPLPVRALLQRRLLAALLCRAGQPVRDADLIEELWGSRPPDSSRKGLQVYIHRLRRLLGDDLQIEYGGAGYTLPVGREQVDALYLQDLIAEARLAVENTQLSRADELYDRAAKLWRGPAYADVPGGVIVHDEAARLEEQRLLAQEEHAAVRLDLGRHGELVPELTTLTRQHPFREQLRAHHMLALYRAGRQSEALEVYRDTRILLTGQLGIEPGPALQRLHAQILRGDAGLDLTPRDSRPLPAQLPPDVVPFAGRAEQLAELDSLVGGGTGSTPLMAIAVISGMAGVGKTALAVHWAHRVIGRFPDGQLYVNLRGFDSTAAVTSPAEAVRDLLDALDVPAHRIPVGLDAQVNLYRSLLAAKRMLILLDNARDADQVRPLLAGSPACLTLVTSRRRLSGLAVQGARTVRLDPLSTVEARDLLSGRVGGGRVSAEPRAVADIIDLCGRLPLALAIAGANAAAQPELALARLADELRGANAGLDAFTGDDPATDLRAVFSWSYHALGTSAARLFRLLGLHPGPDISAAAVASLAAVAPSEVRPILAELTAATLVTEHVRGRFVLHDLLRAYAAELARTADRDSERDAALRRALDHYVHTGHSAAHRLNPTRTMITIDEPAPGTAPESIADNGAALSWLIAERRVLLAAMAAAADRGYDEHVEWLAWALVHFLDRQGHWDDWLSTQSAALAAAQRRADQAGQAIAHRNLGLAHARIARLDDAYLHIQRSVEIFRGIGDHDGHADSHLSLSWIRDLQGRYEEAFDHAQEALRLYTVVGSDAGRAAAFNGMGWYRARQGDYQQAIDYCDQSLAIYREVDSPRGIAATCDSLGYAYHHLGDHRRAITWYQRALELSRELGDRNGEADVLTHLGDTHHALSDLASAREAWRQALAILDELGHPQAEKVRAKLT